VEDESSLSFPEVAKLPSMDSMFESSSEDLQPLPDWLSEEGEQPSQRFRPPPELIQSIREVLRRPAWVGVTPEERGFLEGYS
jgi:hypothetical protein